MQSSAGPSSTAVADSGMAAPARRTLDGFLYKRRRIVGDDDVAGPSAPPATVQPTLTSLLLRHRQHMGPSAPSAQQPVRSQGNAADLQRQRELEAAPVRQILDLQTCGRCSPHLRGALLHTSWSGCDQVTSQPLFMPHHPVLQANVPLPRPHNIHQRFANAMNVGADHVADVKLDRQGELFVVVSSLGSIAVHEFAQLRAHRGHQPRIQSRDEYTGLDPVLLIDAKRRLEAVQWNPNNQNVIATASASDKSIELYDLQSCQGPATQRLCVPSTMEPCGAGCADLAFFAGGQYTMLAASTTDTVFLWDRRASHAPQAVLQDSRGWCGLTCVQLSADDTVVHVGTSAGRVLTWDLRGGRTSAVTFGGGSLHRHPLLAAHDLHAALCCVPGLAQQTNVPTSSVHALAAHPRDSCRLAFHLACGWSGVLDLVSQRITHVHCPPQMWALTEGGGALEALLERQERLLSQMLGSWRTQRRRPAWSACGRSFLVGSPDGSAVLALDFAAGPQSACAVPEPGSEGHEPRSKGFHPPPATRIPVTSPVMALASHPATDELVGGSADTSLLLLAKTQAACEPDDV